MVVSPLRLIGGRPNRARVVVNKESVVSVLPSCAAFADRGSFVDLARSSMPRERYRLGISSSIA
jgi:hypothetical protein